MSYERLPGDPPEPGLEDEPEPAIQKDSAKRKFSWFEYAVFVLLGLAMLWAWNMFLAAAPYFQRRFRTNRTILTNFQAVEISVSTLASLCCMLILTNLQAKARYPRRIIVSLLIYAVAYTLLAMSTKLFLGASPVDYFIFFVIMVLMSSIATGLMQNGTFAYASGFGRPEYMQGIMLGQAVAGILPPIVQIVTVVSAPEEKGGDEDGGDEDPLGQEPSTSAMAYFITATIVSAVTIIAFLRLVAKTRKRLQLVKPLAGYADNASDTDEGYYGDSVPPSDQAQNVPDREPEVNKPLSVPLRVLSRKLFFPAAAVFVTFAVTMVYPVFTQEILSTNPSSSPFLQPAAFIPLAFLLWNIGDLVGRLVPLIPRLSLASRPRMLLALSICRFVYIPLYLLCNVQRPESALLPLNSQPTVAPRVMPDFFYLLVVQFTFGLSNGYLGSCCMMGAGDFVLPREREAAGAYMGLLLVGGLAVGSLCSFFVGNGVG